MNAASGVVKYRNIWELYSFSFLRKRLLIVIPRLTRRPVREADIQKFHRPPLISAAFSPMDAESSGSKLPCVTVFNNTRIIQ